MNSDEKAIYTLIVTQNDCVVFQSNSHWLHPLFELEEFLKENATDMTRAYLRDKVIGKAAALLILRIMPGRVHGELMSELAINTLKHSGIPYSFDHWVERIDCSTEKILEDIDDLETAYQILCKRAKRC